MAFDIFNNFISVSIFPSRLIFDINFAYLKHFDNFWYLL